MHVYGKTEDLHVCETLSYHYIHWFIYFRQWIIDFFHFILLSNFSGSFFPFWNRCGFEKSKEIWFEIPNSDKCEWCDYIDYFFFIGFDFFSLSCKLSSVWNTIYYVFDFPCNFESCVSIMKMWKLLTRWWKRSKELFSQVIILKISGGFIIEISMFWVTCCWLLLTFIFTKSRAIFRIFKNSLPVTRFPSHRISWETEKHRQFLLISPREFSFYFYFNSHAKTRHRAKKSRMKALQCPHNLIESSQMRAICTTSASALQPSES